MENKQSRKITKRQTLREERARQAQRQRILIIGGIVLFVVVIIALVVASSLGGGGGDVIAVTPDAYQSENGAKLGDPNAKVVIDVFEDFECSHCKTFNTDTEPRIVPVPD
jgi:protein-disulfide isomerase